MSFDQKTLYELLPLIYRFRDTEQGKPLEALLGVIADQIAVLEENLAQLYDDQFIETCAEWVTPYLGDLIGYRPLRSLDRARIPAHRKRALSQRAQVANTIAYRRRKGTAAVIEQLARGVTGWEACVVEFFQRLATTQNVNHTRPECTYADLRRWQTGEFATSPFDPLAHTADVRRIDSRHASRGRYNIKNIGIFLWRVQACGIVQARPAPSRDGAPGRCFRFSPLGADMQLYGEPETEETITHLAGYRNVPLPVTRRLLMEEADFYYGPGKSLALHTRDAASPEKVPRPVPQNQIVVCNLSRWDDPRRLPADTYAIDPVLGRLSRPEGDDNDILVSYHYGFTAGMGGGGYDRTVDLVNAETILRVSRHHSSLHQALVSLAAHGDGAQPPEPVLIEFDDNDIHQIQGTFELKDGQALILQAANQRRPSIRNEGDQMVIASGKNSELILSGLLISGGTLRITGKLKRLRIRHCTLVPGLGLTTDGQPLSAGQPSLVVDCRNTRVEIEQSIVGGLFVHPGASITARDSIVDATDPEKVALAAPPDGESAGGALRAQNCTFIGRVHTRQLTLVSNCIFLARGETTEWSVQASRQQEGCVRFSFLPAGAITPRRYHCLSNQALPADALWPRFTSMRYGQPGYCQLTPSCPSEIWQGADDEAEMGAFHDLYQPQREANLRVRLEEYLRFGLEADIFYTS